MGFNFFWRLRRWESRGWGREWAHGLLERRGGHGDKGDYLVHGFRVHGFRFMGLGFKI